MQNKRRVVITGLGAIAPNGIGKDAFWESLVAGKSGIRRISRFDVSKYPSKRAGEVDDYKLKNFFQIKKTKKIGRAAQFIYAVSKEALGDSNYIIIANNAERIGVVIGTAVADLGWAFDEHEVHINKGPLKLNPFIAISMSPNACSSAVSIAFKAKGPSITLSTVCASGLNSVDYAYRLIRDDIVDAMIAGGTEAPLFEPIFDAFCLAGVMSTGKNLACRVPKPFDRDRDGFILSEGAGAVIIEELDHALLRGANIYAEILGSAMTCDAYNPVELNPDAKEATRAIKQALEESRLDCQDIDYINAHGIGSKSADAIETKAIKNVFGKYAYQIPVSSIKSMIGQPIAASGVLQLISSVLMIKNSIIVPTINYDNPDIECDLDYVPNKARKQPVKSVLINSFGFGGKNSALIIKEFKQ
jgi:3-oxoacyl-[acyl-carrier-protein] synthase II